MKALTISQPCGTLMMYERPDTSETVYCAKSFDGSWIVATRRKTSSLKRIKSRALAPCHDREECQRNLDRYAASDKWQPIVTG